MTAPASINVAFDVPTLGSVKLTDGAGNSPAGCQLINPGTHGATVWIGAGPTGAALVPLGAGASMRWTDPATLPYARLAAGATAGETIVVTSQTSDYSNPAAVAVATATQLALQGVPSTFLDTPYGTYTLLAGASSVGINVGESATLLVDAKWPAPPHGMNVALLTFDDPAAPDLNPITIPITLNNAIETLDLQYSVPVLAPRLTITNLQPPDANNAALLVSVVGTNRTSDRLRQLGGPDETSVHNLLRTATFPTTPTPLFGVNGAPAHTRYNGAVSLYINAPAAGFMYAFWVDPTGRSNNWAFTAAAGVTQVPLWAHPRVPVYWQWGPNVAGTGPQSASVAVSGQS